MKILIMQKIIDRLFVSKEIGVHPFPAQFITDFQGILYNSNFLIAIYSNCNNDLNLRYNRSISLNHLQLIQKVKKHLASTSHKFGERMYEQTRLLLSVLKG